MDSLKWQNQLIKRFILSWNLQCQILKIQGNMKYKVVPRPPERILNLKKVHKLLFDSLPGRENRPLQGAIKFASNKKAEEKIIKTDSVQCMRSTSLPASSIDNLTSSGSIRDSSPTSNCCITRWTSLDQRGQLRKFQISKTFFLNNRAQEITSKSILPENLFA